MDITAHLVYDKRPRRMLVVCVCVGVVGCHSNEILVPGHVDVGLVVVLALESAQRQHPAATAGLATSLVNSSTPAQLTYPLTPSPPSLSK